MFKWILARVSDGGNSRTESGTEKDWDEVAKQRLAESTRADIMVIANLAIGSIWAITIVESLLLYSHEGWASLTSPYHNITWTIFTYESIENLILLSIIATIGYVLLRLYFRRLNQH